MNRKKQTIILLFICRNVDMLMGLGAVIAFILLIYLIGGPPASTDLCNTGDWLKLSRTWIIVESILLIKKIEINFDAPYQLFYIVDRRPKPVTTVV